MHFLRDCRVTPTLGSSVLVRQLGRSSCTKVHSRSRQLRHALLYLRGAEPLHPCSLPRGTALHLLPRMACTQFLQEQKKGTKKSLFLGQLYVV
jgi:hypothetical protein